MAMAVLVAAGCADQKDPVTRTGLDDRIEVCALTIQMHDDDRAWQRLAHRGVIERLGQQHRVHVPRRTVTVDENRCRADVRNREGAGGEGQCAHPDCVAGAHAARDQREMQRRGP